MKKIAVLVSALAVSMILLAVPVNATPKASSPAWHTYPVTDTFYEVTYAQLTQMCLDAGLSANPYPAPTTPTEAFVFPFYYLYDVPAYYVFTITIGDEAYPGVSCTIYDLTVNVVTGEGQMVFSRAPHFFGDLGEMNHGFNADITGILHNAQSGPSTPGYYFTVNYLFQGFGRFTGQTMIETQDSRINPNVATGYCLVLGNKWYK